MENYIEESEFVRVFPIENVQKMPIIANGNENGNVSGDQDIGKLMNEFCKQDGPDSIRNLPQIFFSRNRCYFKYKATAAFLLRPQRQVI